MEFLPEAIDQYCHQHSSDEPKILADLSRETRMKVLQPRMLSGHLQGRVLAMFSKMLQARYILEIGTYTGYSAICLAEGLSEGGQLHTIDLNEELEPMYSRYIKAAGMEKLISTHVGNALDIIPTLDRNWDMVFIDADKENYLNYYDLVIERVNAGGLIIADNVLWSGKVVEKAKEKDLETKALQNFNETIQADPRVENVLMPIRDGLMVCRKL